MGCILSLAYTALPGKRRGGLLSSVPACSRGLRSAIANSTGLLLGLLRRVRGRLLRACIAGRWLGSPV